VGRRIDAFERVVGARLFQRRPSGYALTAAGRAVIEHAERIEREALAVERAITGTGSAHRLRIPHLPAAALASGSRCQQ